MQYIVNAFIDPSYNLILVRDDNSTINVRNLGDDECKCVDTVSINSDGDLIIIYMDGSTSNFGYISGVTGFTGPMGSTGVSVERAFIDHCGFLNFEYSNSDIRQVGYIYGTTGFTGPTGRYINPL